MKAVLYEAFSTPPQLVTLPDPAPEPDGVVVRVGATGVCRSDWHGWVGHDPVSANVKIDYIIKNRKRLPDAFILQECGWGLQHAQLLVQQE